MRISPSGGIDTHAGSISTATDRWSIGDRQDEAMPVVHPEHDPLGALKRTDVDANPFAGLEELQRLGAEPGVDDAADGIDLVGRHRRRGDVHR